MFQCTEWLQHGSIGRLACKIMLTAGNIDDPVLEVDPATRSLGRLLR